MKTGEDFLEKRYVKWYGDELGSKYGHLLSGNLSKKWAKMFRSNIYHELSENSREKSSDEYPDGFLANLRYREL